MTHPRAYGLVLMGLAIVSLAGNTYDDTLPPEIFLAGLALGPLGLVIYMRGSRAATKAAEVRTERALRPRIRNDRAEAHASQQALNPLSARSAREALNVRAEPAPSAPRTLPALEIPSSEEPEDLVFANEAGDDPFDALSSYDEVAFDVSDDVSFPLEIQEAQSVAEQLERLQKLLREGIITDAEFDTAKAKLLG